MKLNEVFNLKNANMQDRTGKMIPIVYIDPETSESAYNYKDELKNRFHAKWFGHLKAWGWFVGSKPEQLYRNTIQPCLEWLKSVEKPAEDGSSDPRTVVQIIDELLANIGGNSTVSSPGKAKDEENAAISSIKDKLKSFKQDLISAVNDEEFKKLMEPIINLRRAQGHQFSFINSILLFIQDPNARLVKSKGNWVKYYNREVKPGSPAIALWVPNGRGYVSSDKRKAITDKFIRLAGVKTVSDLTPGDKEELNVRLRNSSGSSFSLMLSFYDVRFTELINGKEDVLGNIDSPDVPWYDESGEETDFTRKLGNSIMKLITDSGVKLDFVGSDKLGRARGVSKSGSIEVLEGIPMNAGTINTLIHEFSHELLHQTYLKSHNDELSGYFVGQPEGRGKVEQQAELSAWIVLKNFGIDMPTNINYIGLWGLNNDNASEVFDSVAKVAQYIINGMEKNMETITESRIIKEDITGLDVADMLGLRKLYIMSKRKRMQMSENVIRIGMGDIIRMVENCMAAYTGNRVL